MKVLHISTSDSGGAGKACLRLHKGLRNIGVESNVLVRWKRNNDDLKVFPYRITHKNFFSRLFHEIKHAILRKLNISSKFDKFKSNRSSSLELFSLPYSKHKIEKSAFYNNTNLINLHWVADFLDYSSFFKYCDKPIVWTLHDMNPFTGGEHYSEKYNGIDEKGYPIKRVITEGEKKLFKNYLMIKKTAMENCENLTIVTPSKWLFDEAKNSEIFMGRPIRHIPYGLDETIFRPREKRFCKEVFEIPEDKIVILFVADDINNNRKGLKYLLSALEGLNCKDFILCSVGNNSSAIDLEINYKHLGAINDERLMSMVYSAADVFVIPSLMDNLPNTVLESLMCGTPAIGFPIGGIVDMIVPEITGYLAEKISVESLRITILKFLNDPSFFDRKAIRNFALENYSLNKQAEAYKELYEHIFNERERN
ncbi:glycosyltransferase [Aegicerativicinus sediminis]|uniref:glycosyltransferase n=1 Tax=Aegicerativicinus sediminis TaxID=2893202 RepID=UPI001E4573B7|nr:glycosyltransferase [Aegicerativicinus sediminis]